MWTPPKPPMTLKESALYPPIKTYLESQGYTVKSEIGHLDLLAIRGEEPPIVVELKTSFSLTLILQGVERQTLFDQVYLAVPVQTKGWTLRYKDVIRLCRRLGLGLLAVKGTTVEAHLDPGPHTPRKNVPKSARLLREFDRRTGDPQSRRNHRDQADDGLPAGRRPTGQPSRNRGSDQSRRRRPRDRYSPRRHNPARRSLWLV